MKINAFAFLLVVFISANSAAAHVSLPSDTVFNQTDSRNLKQGFWKKHYKNGKVAYQGFFKDDKPRGEFSRNGINNIVSLQPFGCIANHVISKGIEKRTRELYPNLNILFLDFDSGMSEANIFNRLHFMIKQ